MKKHHFAPDTRGSPDHQGHYPCRLCGLPEANRHHREVPVDVLGERINGEGEAGPWET